MSTLKREASEKLGDMKELKEADKDELQQLLEDIEKALQMKSEET